jgi:hypothetical protein
MSKRTAATIPTGQKEENGHGIPDEARGRDGESVELTVPEAPAVVVGAVQISLVIYRVAGGVVSSPQTLTYDVVLVDGRGIPLPGVTLRSALHEGVDITVDRLEAMQRGEA